MALAHGRRLLRMESSFGVDIELSLNRWLSGHASLALAADYVYATLHYLVTPLVLLWLWRAHRSEYARARTALALTTLIGLVVFTLLPVAPPRMLPGYIDTMAQFASSGWWQNDASAPRGLGGLTNQFAALPSLHVGWAVWAGWQLFRHGRRAVTRVAAVAYPAVTSVVVVATANHYVLDVVTGGLVVVLGGGLAAAAAAVRGTLASPGRALAAPPSTG